MSHEIDDRIIIPSLARAVGVTPSELEQRTWFSAPEIELDAYDNIIVCMSGGKDSIATLLHLVDQNVDMSRVELWHHDVDGREGSTLMDWPFMADYNRKLAAAFGLPLYYSWLEGGFEGEMLKDNAISRPHKIETPTGIITAGRDLKRSTPSSRLRFPQVSPSLQTRWCSSALKIDVGRRALTQQSRFDGKKVLFITGERREESHNRSRYNQFEPHSCDRNKRRVDAWRPVLHWQEDRVWDALARHGVVAPVPYRLGWSRSSCMTCIYNAPKVWATIRHYFPNRIEVIAEYEKRFGVTISRKLLNVMELTEGVTPIEIRDFAALKQSQLTTYELPVIQTAVPWVMPVGAFKGETCGAN